MDSLCYYKKTMPISKFCHHILAGGCKSVLKWSLYLGQEGKTRLVHSQSLIVASKPQHTWERGRRWSRTDANPPGPAHSPSPYIIVSIDANLGVSKSPHCQFHTMLTTAHPPWYIHVRGMRSFFSNSLPADLLSATKDVGILYPC